PIAEIPDKIRNIVSNFNAYEKVIATQQKELSQYEAKRIILENTKEIRGIRIINTQVSSTPMSALLQLGDVLKDELKSAVIVLATIYEDKPYFMATITNDLIPKGLHSGKLIKKISEIAGGSGGGKAETAQAGAKYKEKLADAIQAVPRIVEDFLEENNA
ncbi:MAG: DHHA1 domain-containing protein, partial [Chloroflexi bacterium]|nr:DHHA1 domain-containing protein [Chloroflexota bacterium]